MLSVEKLNAFYGSVQILHDIDLTVGTGLAGKHVRLDLGALIGREWGSGDGLVARKISISIGFQL